LISDRTLAIKFTKTWRWSDPAPIADAIGPPEQKFRAFEQIFGANQQAPHVGGCDKKWRQRRGAIYRVKPLKGP
jgi:hypothetical protein